MAVTATASLIASVSAYATAEEGHPEWYSNNVRLTTNHVGFTTWGPMHFSSESLPEELECENLGFGYFNNEGTPAFGRGQIDGWTAQGNETTGGTEVSRTCRVHPIAGREPEEGWITDEPAVETTRNVPLSVPWNVEVLCVESEGTKKALVRIGLPTGTANPSPGCKAQSERAQEIEAEETARTGCYATTVPEGCMKIDVAIPAYGTEQIFQGALNAVMNNGFTSGLHPSSWEFSGITEGKLHLKSAFSFTAATFSKYLVTGTSALQLITNK
jgi:hypothetical protein